MKSAWVEILKQVHSGELGVEEGARQIAALEAQLPAGADALPGAAVDDGDVTVYPAPEAGPQAADPSAPGEAPRPDLGWWPNAWLIPFGAGTLVFVLAAAAMGWAYAGQHFFWFYCAWLPLGLGLAALLLGAWSRQARWVHVRVQDADGGRVAISLPIPLRLGSWGLRILGPLIPAIREQHLDQLPVVLDELAACSEPMTVEVDDNDGRKVRVYIG